ncbi:DUF6973 domain-containing protein [Lutimonas sp.]|uniref:DUF6973 domain-containing protein n=1 Tax=Lutimonas sp. TaxID=1872403 RepID=UPI003D9BF8FB
MKRAVILILLTTCIQQKLHSQAGVSGFSELSSNEKWWVVFHPFKAKRALAVSLETLRLTDSIKKAGTVGRDNNGGHLDAFKHTYWMLALSREIGPNSASSLGRAHEKGNFKSFKKGTKEDGFLPDKVSSEMDLFNNQAGVNIYKKYPKDSQDQDVQHVLSHLEKGKLRMIKKDGSLFINCEGDMIDPLALKGSWENDKCLIPTSKI